MVNNQFYVINDLFEYLENGKGVSDIIVDEFFSFVKFQEWQTLINGLNKVDF